MLGCCVWRHHVSLDNVILPFHPESIFLSLSLSLSHTHTFRLGCLPIPSLSLILSHQTRAVELNLQRNRLSDTFIPNAIGDLVFAEEIWLSFNDIQATLPPTIGRLSSLRECIQIVVSEP